MNDRTILSLERPARAALISPDASFRSLIMGCLEESAPSVEWVLRAESDVVDLRPESVDRLAERGPDLLFLDVGSSLSAGVTFVSAAAERIPGLTIVAAGGALGVDELLELIRAGASGYLRRPWNRNEIANICANALRKLTPRRLDAEEPVNESSHLIAVFAPKGGTGVSTLAANLAIHIRRATSKKTLLLDFSPELGTCTALLGVIPRYSYLDVLEGLGRMDERLLYSFLEEHESGTWVLPSPASPFMARQLSSESVTALARLARRYFDYVLVDVGRGVMDEAAATMLELADRKLLVTTPELPTLRNVKQIVPHLPQDQGAEEPSIHLVVNRYEEGQGVPTKDIERAVGLPPFQILNEDRERVSRSANLGRPIVMNGSSPYSRAVGRLGDRLAGPDLQAKAKKSGFGGLIRTVLPSFGRRNGTKDQPEKARAEDTKGRPERARTQSPLGSTQRARAKGVL